MSDTSGCADQVGAKLLGSVKVHGGSGARTVIRKKYPHNARHPSSDERFGRSKKRDRLSHSGFPESGSGIKGVKISRHGKLNRNDIAF